MKLNPKLFSGDKMLPEVRKKFTDIVEEFIKFIEKDGIKLSVAGIQIVGSNADYNYSDTSDIDLQLIADFTSVNPDANLVRVTLWHEKTRFNETFKPTIRGIPVEIYVADVKLSAFSNGIYDILEDKWIKKPEKVEAPEVNIENEVGGWESAINAMVDSGDLTPEKIQGLMNSIYMLRKNSLAVDGQYSKGNLIYKALAHGGAMDKLQKKRTEMITQNLSISESFRLEMEKLLNT